MKYCPQVDDKQLTLLAMQRATAQDCELSDEITITVATRKGLCSLILPSPIIDVSRFIENSQGIAMALKFSNVVEDTILRIYVTMLRAEYVADMCAETIVAGLIFMF